MIQELNPQEVAQVRNILRDTFLANLSYEDYQHFINGGNIVQMEKALALAVTAFEYWRKSLNYQYKVSQERLKDYWQLVESLEVNVGEG